MAPDPKPKRWPFLLPLALGVLVLVLAARQGDAPDRRQAEPEPRVVRTIEVPRVTVVPRALGYGRVEPERVWEAVAQVSGRVVEAHPRLRKGALLQADTLLVRIDPADYVLAASQVEADILSTRAQLAEMAVREDNIRASLAIETEALALREAELERNRELVAKGTVSASQFEQEQRNLLAQRQQVQAQQSALNLLPAERRVLEAQLARFEAQLERARLDLARTEVRLPFRARIAEVNVEEAQYVREGTLLAKADGIARAEVEAQIPVGRMRAMLDGQTRTVDLSRTDPAQVTAGLGIRARVWLRDPGGDVGWPAEVSRFSDTLDPDTRTIGVIVAVDEPYGEVLPGERPPLVKGLFVEVELRGQPRPDSLAVPIDALHGGSVYLVEDGRLAIRPVTVASRQPEYAVIAAGLEPGDTLVVSDLVPAVEGMRLTAEPDPDALRRLVRTAGGEPATP
jgi:multidrug efflux pump subunit AcrA (membrane-fusion protein)